MKKSWSLIFAVLFFVLFALKSEGQLANDIIEIYEDGVQNHVACQSIILKPGYQYIASLTDYMSSRIDPNLICDASYSEDEFSPLNSGNFSTRFEVGTTEGNFSVSSTGAGVYNIKIMVPPGTMGMEPQLNISYNSQASNGMLGVGWSLNGLGVSSISRGSHNIYYGGHISPVTLTNSDWFLLDGQHLVPYGTNGADGTLYKTEVENYSRIISHGTGVCPSYFTVETKEGLTFEYGRSSDSYIEAKSTSVAMTWLLNKVTDRTGNYFIVSYYEDDLTGEFRINQIDYTGNVNQGFGPYNSVKFEYGNRRDKQMSYLSGYPISQSVLLSSVKIFCEGNLTKTYDLTYNDSRCGSHLSTIIEKGVDGKQYNPITIGWNVSSNVNLEDPSINNGEINLGHVPNIATTAATKYVGDFNGDGFTDIYLIHYQTQTDPGITWELYLNNEGLGYFGVTPFTGSMPAGYRVSVMGIGNSRRSASIVDIDKDGKDDIILSSVGSGNVDIYLALLWNQTSGNFEIFNMFSPILGDNALIPDPNNAPNLIHNPDNGKFELIGDFDGDGTSDIFIHYYHNSKDRWYIHNFKTGQTYEGAADWGNENLSFNTVDFDGDGTDEILFTFHNSEYQSDGLQDYNYVLSLNSNSLDVISHGGWPNSCEGKYNNIFQGDFNGDGRTDILTYNYCSNVWSIGYAIRTNSTGTSIQYMEFDAPFDPYPGNPNPAFSQNFCEYLVGDYNGDGKSDIALFYHYYNSGQQTYYKFVDMYYSLGNNEFKYERIDNLPNTNPNSVNSFLGDFNGDGHTDIIQNCPSPHMQVGIYFNSSAPDGIHPASEDFNKVSSITNGFNETTFIDYNTLSLLSNNNYYVPNSDAEYPLIDVTRPLSVVRKISKVNGIGGRENIYYNYEGGKAHVLGKGFLGFKKIIESNDATQFSKETEYTIQPQFFISLPVNSKIFYQGGLYTESSTEFNVLPLSSLNFTVQLEEQTAFDYISDYNTLTNEIIYDNFGNITHKKVAVNGTLEIIETSSTFIEAGYFIPSKIETITSTKKRLTESPSTSVIHYGYNTNGTIKDVFENYLTSKEIHTEFIYSNDVGLMNEKNVHGNNVVSLNYKFEYDPYFRFITKESNPLNQFTLSQFNPQFGLPSSIQGLDSRLTLYEYDGFGRLLSTLDPENIRSESLYAWELPGSISNGDPLGIASHICFSITSKKDGSPTQKKYFDLLGRELQSELDGFAEKINIQKKYLANGNLQAETRPFKSSQSSIVKIKYYYQGTSIYRPNDLYSVVITDDIDSYVSNYQYTYSGGGNTEIEVTNQTTGSTTSKTTDAVGKLISSIDEGGALEYTFHSNGFPKAILINGLEISSMEYDDFGNQISLTDKDLGTLSYTYDGFNRLISQEDNNANVTDGVQYDLLNRVVSKTIRKGIKNYTYSYSFVPFGSNGTNQLASSSVIGSDGNFSTIHAYNINHRLENIEERIDGDIYTSAFQYDSYGNLSKTTHSTGIEISRSYNSMGYPMQIKDEQSGEILWQGLEMNSNGNYSKYSLGPNSLETEISFDNFGFPTRIFSQSRQDLNLKFNPATGNLDWRKDISSGRNLKEEFSYDNLDRLIQAQVTSPTILPVNFQAYNLNNTMSEKNDAGIFSEYSINHVNAIQKVTDPGNSIAINQQDIIYTPFNKFSSISEGDFTLEVKYGESQQKRKSELSFPAGQITKTHFYEGEKIIDGMNVNEVYYVNSPSGLCGLIVLENGIKKTYYVYKDQIESIVKLTDENGLTTYEQNFDAWGRMRNPNDWTFTGVQPKPDWLSIGFTGQEHLDEFDLIDFNQRLYDPILGSMLSPDKFVGNASKSIAFNRYSYANGNPLSYVDPSGNNPVVAILIASAIVGGYAGGAIVNNELNPEDWSWSEDTWWGIGFGAAIAAGGAAILAEGGSIAIMYGSSELLTITPAAATTFNISVGSALAVYGGSKAIGNINWDNVNSAAESMIAGENAFSNLGGSETASLTPQTLDTQIGKYHRGVEAVYFTPGAQGTAVKLRKPWAKSFMTFDPHKKLTGPQGSYEKKRDGLIIISSAVRPEKLGPLYFEGATGWSVDRQYFRWGISLDGVNIFRYYYGSFNKDHTENSQSSLKLWNHLYFGNSPPPDVTR